jgi:hypothetical protein
VLSEARLLVVRTVRVGGADGGDALTHDCYLSVRSDDCCSQSSTGGASNLTLP